MMKENGIYFSIIVPVYKVEDYLEECVNSVLCQDFDSFELILVDDGSPDRCGEMCDEFAERDSRIRVIRQANGGASAARNHGLQYAAGEFVLFLDSDDFYPQKDLLRKLWKKSQGQDLVLFNYARYTDHLLSLLTAFPEEEAASPEEELLELVKRNAFTSSPCLKAVRRALLTEHAITFEEGTSAEDIEWNAKLLRTIPRTAFAPDCVYAYRVRGDSITHSMSPKYVHMLLRIIKKLIADPPQGSRAFCDAYWSYIAFQYCTILINMHLCRPKIDKETREEIKTLSWLLKYDTNRIVKLVHTVYRILGLQITSWLLLIYFKLFCK